MSRIRTLHLVSAAILAASSATAQITIPPTFAGEAFSVRIDGQPERAPERTINLGNGTVLGADEYLYTREADGSARWTGEFLGWRTAWTNGAVTYEQELAPGQLRLNRIPDGDHLTVTRALNGLFDMTLGIDRHGWVAHGVIGFDEWLAMPGWEASAKEDGKTTYSRRDPAPEGMFDGLEDCWIELSITVDGDGFVHGWTSRQIVEGQAGVKATVQLADHVLINGRQQALRFRSWIEAPEAPAPGPDITDTPAWAGSRVVAIEHGPGAGEVSHPVYRDDELAYGIPEYLADSPDADLLFTVDYGDSVLQRGPWSVAQYRQDGW